MTGARIVFFSPRTFMKQWSNSQPPTSYWIEGQDRRLEINFVFYISTYRHIFINAMIYKHLEMFAEWFCTVRVRYMNTWCIMFMMHHLYVLVVRQLWVSGCSVLVDDVRKVISRIIIIICSHHQSIMATIKQHFPHFQYEMNLNDS